jgi:hypothetical protein
MGKFSVRLNIQAQGDPMTRDQEQAAALEDIARVRPAVEKLRELFAAAVAADRASGSTSSERAASTARPPAPTPDHGDDPDHPSVR